MRKNLFIVASLFLVGCGDSTPVQNNPVTSSTDTLVESVASKTDENVEVETPIVDTYIETMQLGGVVEVPAQNSVTISLPMDMSIVSTTLIEGQSVNSGSVIATVTNPAFISLQQEYLDALSQTEYLETEYNRQLALESEDATSKKRLQQSKAEYLSAKSRRDGAAAQLKIIGVTASEISKGGIITELDIKSPTSGYVTNLNINRGKHINAGDAMCDIINKSSMLVNLTAYEKDLAALSVGSMIDFKVNGLSGQNFTAKIISIGQQFNKENRSTKVYAQVIGNNHSLRPGMFVVATLK